MAPPDFHLQAHVDHLYQQPRKLAFQARSPAEFERWQRDLRGKVAELLGITGRKLPATVEARLITRTDRGSYTEEKLAIDTDEGTQTPLYVLVPKTEPPYKPIPVFHGHNPSVHYVLGTTPMRKRGSSTLRATSTTPRPWLRPATWYARWSNGGSASGSAIFTAV